MTTETLMPVQHRREVKSQALVEFAIVLPIFLTLMAGVFDYGWMIGNSNVMALAAREAANTASRQTEDMVSRGLEAAIDSSRPRLDLASELGGVIITRVLYDTDINAFFVSVPPQLTNNCQSTGGLYGGGDALKDKSRILLPGTSWDENSLRALPFDADNLADKQTMYVVEIFYTNQFVTPIGTLIGLVTPPRLYDAAFY